MTTTNTKRVAAGVVGAFGLAVAVALLFPGRDAAAGEKCPNVDRAVSSTQAAIGHAANIAGSGGEKQAALDDLTKALNHLNVMAQSPVCR